MPGRIDWPAYSPDLSPLENVWSWIKQEVAKDCPKSLKSLKESIIKHWRRINVEFLAPFINSMPQRMEAVIQNKGGKTKY